MSSPQSSPSANGVNEVEAAYPSVGTLVKETTAHFSTLLRSELELAKAEVTAEAKKAVTGSILLVVAGVMVLLALPFLFVALAEGLVQLGLYRWASYLIVFGLFLVVAGVLAFVGIKRFKKVRAPQRTVEELKKNSELGQAIKSGQEHGAEEAQAIASS